MSGHGMVSPPSSWNPGTNFPRPLYRSRRRFATWTTNSKPRASSSRGGFMRFLLKAIIGGFTVEYEFGKFDHFQKPLFPKFRSRVHACASYGLKIYARNARYRASKKSCLPRLALGNSAGPCEPGRFPIRLPKFQVTPKPPWFQTKPS